ncbi:hypothetical protein BP5796_05709 [Coleophoma crateriformis]|uniref:Heterokaryon incompatibility domain-containing protein n=1 Tax=Coleophoma crateriformis TaxID=565419 RepID=A0A3D8RUW1_9HELO|nr:hypothetical protein BP5796_05709 [Coleophoma crateriformis]
MKYDPLIPSRNQIRVLTLHSSTLEDSVQCTLSTISLDFNPAFSALSYVWGDPKVTAEITVDGTSIQVTTNLEAALRQIRQSFGQFILWVDAVCINQKDDLEKGQQVQLMGDIYKKAERVIGWLGPEQDDSHIALEIFKRIPRATEDHVLRLCSEGRWDDVGLATRPNSKAEHTGWVQEMPQLTTKFWYHYEPHRSIRTKLAKLVNQEPPVLKPRFWHRGNFRSLGQMILRGDWKHVAWTLNPKFGTLSPGWSAICAFLRRDYWTRIWILQEFILASKLVLMCGNATMDEKAVEGLEQMLYMLHLCGLNQHPKGMDAAAFGTFSNDTSWKSAYTTIQLRNTPSEKKLIELVARFQVLDATNPRDRIYALIGLSTDTIEPKYRNTVEEVYCEFAARWVNVDRDASILAYAEPKVREGHFNSTKRQLPSWVPDWEDGNVEPGKKFRLGQLDGKTSIEELTNYCASSQLCSWRVSNNILFALGVRFDLVSSLGPQLSINHEALREYFRTYLDAAAKGPYPTRIPRSEALFRLLLLDMDSYTKKRLDSNSKTYAELAHAFAYGIMSNHAGSQQAQVEAAINLASELSAPYLDAASGAEVLNSLFIAVLSGRPIAVDGGVQDARNAIQVDLINAADAVYHHMLGQFMLGWTNRRKVFMTGKGYLGIGPKEMQERDVVAVLDGCRMPVILRRIGDGYCFMGLCFVLGLMDGEAATMVEEGGAVTEHFEIL